MPGSLLDRWPDLSDAGLSATIETLHLWCQIAGKVRLATTPWLNHSWHVPLYVSTRGLATGPISNSDMTFEIVFDLLDEVLVVQIADGRRRLIDLRPGNIADFYAELSQVLAGIGLLLAVDDCPCEMTSATPFTLDQTTRQFDAEIARAYWGALLQVQRVFNMFRTRFIGKCSPIHLFWGSFDLVVTRFSGRAAPRHPGNIPHLSDAVVRDAYSHEQIGTGFWAGSGDILSPSFYTEAYPTPADFGSSQVLPKAATYDSALQEFLLPYAAVRASADPDGDLLSFLQTTYEAAAIPGRWDRAALERPQGEIGHPPDG